MFPSRITYKTKQKSASLGNQKLIKWETKKGAEMGDQKTRKPKRC